MCYHTFRKLFSWFLLFSFLQAKAQVRDSTRRLTPLEQDNFNIVAEFHAGRGVIRKFIESGKVSSDVEWFVPGPKQLLPFAGLWKGLDGITEFNRLLDATMQYDTVQIKQYIVDGNEVAAIFHAAGIAIATGKPFRSDILRLYTFKNGMIVRVSNFYDTASYVAALSK